MTPCGEPHISSRQVEWPGWAPVRSAREHSWTRRIALFEVEGLKQARGTRLGSARARSTFGKGTRRKRSRGSRQRSSRARERGSGRGRRRRSRPSSAASSSSTASSTCAAPHLERALELAEALRLPEVFAQALTSKSILFTTPEPPRRGAHPARGCARPRARARPARCCRSARCNNLGVVLEASDRYADAVDLDRPRARARAPRRQPRLRKRARVGGGVSSLVLLGRWDEALARAAELPRQCAGSIRACSTPLVDGRSSERAICSARGVARALLEFASRRIVQDHVRRSPSRTRRLLRAEGKPRRGARPRRVGVRRAGRARHHVPHRQAGLVEALEAAFALGDDGEAAGAARR